MGRYFSLGLILFLGLSACSSKKQYQQEIETLEADLAQETQGALAEELRAAYLAYVEQFPTDTALNSRYLYRYAGLSYRMQDTPAALVAIHQALEDYYSSDNTLNNAILLATLYEEELQKTQVSTTILQGIELVFPGQASRQDLQLSSNLPDVFMRLDTLRNQIFNEITYAINFPLANDYITAVEEFSRVAARHPQVPELLFKAAEIARSIQTYQKAIELFDWLEDKYPGHQREAQALFLKAFTLDDGLKDYAAAKLAYEYFIEQYPDDPFADDARFSLKNLGKDVEELINEFEQQDEKK